MTRLLQMMSLLGVGALLWAADSVPLDPVSPHPRTGEKLEVEQLEIRGNVAVPNLLHRKPGRFVLLITNRSRLNPDEAFVIDLSSVGDGKLGDSPVLRVGGSRLNDYKHRSAFLFDAPVGDYDLKSVASGKILCHIQINSTKP